MASTTQKITMETYSAKSFVVRGDTFQVKEELKSMGGKWNKFLKGGAGWVFNNSQKTEAEEWLAKTKNNTEEDVCFLCITCEQPIEHEGKCEICAEEEEIEDEEEDEDEEEEVEGGEGNTWSSIPYRYDVVKKRWSMLQNQFGQLSSYKLVFSKRLETSAGICKYTSKTIELADRMMKWEDSKEEEVIDTLLHETAHALAGSKAHHGPVWKKWALKIGGTGDRCHNMTFTQSNAKAYYVCACSKHPINRITNRVKQVMKGNGIVRCKKCKGIVHVVLN